MFQECTVLSSEKMTCRTPDLTVGLNLTEIEIERLRSKIIPVLQDGEPEDDDDTTNAGIKSKQNDTSDKDKDKEKDNSEDSKDEGKNQSGDKVTPYTTLQRDGTVTTSPKDKDKDNTEGTRYEGKTKSGDEVTPYTTIQKEETVTEWPRGKNESGTKLPQYSSTKCNYTKVEESDDFSAALFNCTIKTTETITCSNGTVRTETEYKFRDTPRCKRLHNRDRQKRATEPAEPLNNNDLSFYIGFEFDGLSTYDNFTSLPVYEDPEYFQFEEAGSLRSFTRKDVYLHIKGQRLTLGITIKDVKVTIGAGVCDITDLATNKLICKPPTEHPGHGEVEGPQNSVHVKVGYVWVPKLKSAIWLHMMKYEIV